MFISKNTVRMHDTDMAGILYFARQYRFAHDAWEDLLESEGIVLKDLFAKSPYLFVIVHSEADYYRSLMLGDHIEVRLTISSVGNTSFTVAYGIYIDGTDDLMGMVKTVHVCVDAKSREKIRVPQSLRDKMTKYFS
ncbi:MAG: thioesterase family protein [bacterium]|nr:thioesterase family protein [bacterium]